MARRPMSPPRSWARMPVCRQSDRGSDPGTGCPAFFTCGASAPRRREICCWNDLQCRCGICGAGGYHPHDLSGDASAGAGVDRPDRGADCSHQWRGSRVIWSDITSALINDPQVSREAAEVAKGLGDHIQVVTNRPLSWAAITLLSINVLYQGATPILAQQTQTCPAH